MATTPDPLAHPGATAWSTRLWSAGEASYRAILEHPFLAGLADGSLPRDRFAYYIVQDSHYLRSYSRCLSLLSGRAPAEDQVQTLARHSADAIEVERELHSGLLADLGLAPVDLDRIGAQPTTVAYLSYLTAVCATGSFAEGIAAVLPCYWVYREVGAELIGRGSVEPLYQRWIDTYGGEEFDQTVREALAITDAQDPSAAEELRAQAHFAMSTRYEWMFWDAAWHQLPWPL